MSNGIKKALAVMKYFPLSSIALSFACCVFATTSYPFQDDFLNVFNSPEVDAFVMETDWEINRVAEKDAAMELINLFGLVDLLKLDFFKKTYPINKRNLLDFPLWLPHRKYGKQCFLSCHFLFNQTSKMNFTKNSTSICSYLAIKDPTFVNRLEEVADQVKELQTLFDINIRQLIDLFADFNIQERKAGIMFHGFKEKQKWRTSAHVPFYFLERNFFVIKSTQDELEDIIEDLFGPGDEAEQERFQEQHLIADKLGFGDTRITIDYDLYHGEKFDFRVGGFITIPTAFKLQSGLKGNGFDPLKERPELDFLQVLDSALQQSDEAEQLTTDFGLKILDSLSAQLLDTGLGNNGHVGFGVVLQGESRLSWLIKRPWADKIKTYSRLSIEYLAPKNETRWFIPRNNEDEFKVRNFKEIEDQAILCDNFDFITKTVTDRVFPHALKTRVHPGFVLRWTSQYTHEKDNYGWTIGMDTWLRSKEDFSNIKKPCGLTEKLNVCIAKAPYSYQGKLFGTFFFKWQRSDTNGCFGITVDNTYESSGIGEDISICIKFEMNY